MRYSLIMGNKNYSSWSLRPWLVLKHLNIPFDEHIVPLMSDGFKEQLFSHSKSGKVPVLKLDGREVWDSLAICETLNDFHPDAGLWPAEGYARAIARSVSHEMHSGFATVRNDMPMNVRRQVANFKPSAACQVEIDRIIEIWEDCRDAFGGGGDFLFGNFSIADAMFAPVVFRFETYQIPVSEKARAYMDHMLGLSAMKEWTVESIAEDWVIEAAEV